MKIAELIVLGILSPFALLAHSHRPELSVTYDSNGDHSALIEHQTAFIFDADDILIFDAKYKPKYDKTHFAQLGFGYRKFFDSFGFGINCFGSTSNLPRYFAYEFSPGLELFMGRFQLSYNQYIPYEDVRIYRKKKLTFDTISEIDLTYKPSRKYEFSVTPYFNHSSRKIGIAGGASAFVFDQWQVKASPFYEQNNRGLKLALVFSFGGAKGKSSQSIRKRESFVFDGLVLPKKERVLPTVALLPEPVAPVFLPPIELDEVKKPDDTPPEETVKKPLSWWDFFFRGLGK
jgi:hypothetical protein